MRRGLFCLFTMMTVLLARPAYSDFDAPGEPPILVEVKLYGMKCKTAACRNVVDGDNFFSGVDTAEMYVIVRIGYPDHLPAIFVGGAVVKLTNFGTFPYNASTHGITMFAHVECTELDDIAISTRVIELDPLGDTIAVRASSRAWNAATLFLKVPTPISAAVTVLQETVFSDTLDGHDDLGFGGPVVYSGPNNLPPDGLIGGPGEQSVDTTDVGLSMVVRVTPQRDLAGECTMQAPQDPPQDEVVSECHRSNFEAVYDGWKTDLDAADLLHNEPQVPNPLSSSELEALREDVRAGIMQAADSFTQALATSISFSARQSAAQGLVDQARAQGDHRVALLFYASAALIAFDELSFSAVCPGDGGGESPILDGTLVPTHLD